MRRNKAILGALTLAMLLASGPAATEIAAPVEVEPSPAYLAKIR